MDRQLDSDKEKNIRIIAEIMTKGTNETVIPGRIIPKTFKMVLDTSFINTQQYKVHIKDKVKQSRERNSALPYTLV